MKRIFTSLAPNMERDDRRLAGHLLLRPWQWRRGDSARKLEQWFTDFTGASVARSFTSGRGSLYAILKSLRLPKGSEVLLQAYTCVAVPDPVLWAGLRPVYVDCTNLLTMSPDDLEKKISANSKVLIIQHTFGQPADLEKLLMIAKKAGLFVIEDCAHSLGGTHQNRKLGSFGDAAFFSFGRDKVLSSVFGGVAVVRDAEIGSRLAEVHNSFALPSLLWVKQQLLHLFVLSFAKRFYDRLAIGKVFLELAKRMRLISRAVYPNEKHGGAPRFVFRRMPEAMAQLALHQLTKLDRFNTHRRQLALLYADALRLIGVSGVPYGSGEGVFLRYAAFHQNAAAFLLYARKRGVELGDWYTTPVAPQGVTYAAVGYVPGSCPVAESKARETFNLPTHIGIRREDAEQVISLLRTFLF